MIGNQFNCKFQNEQRFDNLTDDHSRNEIISIIITQKCLTLPGLLLGIWKEGQ